MYGFRRHYLAGEGLWNRGEKATAFTLISQGLVEGIRNLSENSTTIMAFFGPGDIIGLPAFTAKSVFPGTARALTGKVEVIKFYLHPALEEKNKLQSAELQELNGWLRLQLVKHDQHMLTKIDLLQAATAEDRLKQALEQLRARFAPTDNPHFIPLRLTRALLAGLTGLRTETIIRIVNQWQKDGLIKWNSRGILFNPL